MLMQSIETLTKLGYSVTMSCEADDKRRIPARPEDREVGTGKRWYVAINKSHIATEFATGYGDTVEAAFNMAIRKEGYEPEQLVSHMHIHRS